MYCVRNILEYRVRHPWADRGAVAEFLGAVLGGQWPDGAANGSECHR